MHINKLKAISTNHANQHELRILNEITVTFQLV